MKLPKVRQRSKRMESDNYSSSWQQWCRLCAKDDAERNISVFDKTESDIVDSTLPTAIGKFFWVNMKVTDVLPKYLCMECYTLITSLMAFTERVNKVQAMFCAIENSNGSDPNDLRSQYGVNDDDRQHIIPSKTFNLLRENLRDDDEEIAEEVADEVMLIDEIAMTESETQSHDKADQIEDAVDIVDESDQDTCAEELEFTYEVSEEDMSQFTSNEEHKGDKDDADDDSQEEFPDGNKIQYDDISNISKNSHLQTEKSEENLLIEAFKSDSGDEIDEEKNSECVTDDKRRGSYYSVNNSDDNVSEVKPQKRRRGRPSKYKDDDLPESVKITNADVPITTIQTIYECSICIKKYKNLTSYRKHMIENHNKEPDIPEYMCDKCDKKFPSQRQLEVHARSHLPLEEKMIVPCPYCEKKFTKLSVMRNHLNGTHYQEKSYICDECGKPLKTLAALNEHKLVHTSDCPFECKYCGKKFKNKPRLKVHIDTHTDTSYICSVCGLHLNTRRTLKMHMLVHSDNRRYKCDFCGNEFKRSKALKNHLILHTGLRPYKCNFCGKTFSNGSNCRSHKKKSHPEELAQEEAAGIKIEPTVVPKLEDLKNGRSGLLEGAPRNVKRYAGGLSAKTRALLKADEQRRQRLEKDNGNEAHFPNIMEDGVIQVDGIVVGDDEDDEETVIYEIIQEV